MAVIIALFSADGKPFKGLFIDLIEQVNAALMQTLMKLYEQR